MAPRESNKTFRHRACAARRPSASSPRARRSSSSARARRTSRAARRPPNEALAKRQLETAKQIVAALGTMKGAAMKLGQVMSFLDVGLVEEEYREEFQRELAKLRDAAPTVSFKQMRRVIEDDLEQPIAEVFASFDAGADRGRLDRAGLPGDAARRARGRGQGPVPGGRRRGARGHAEPGHDHAPAQADDAGDGRQGDRRGDPRADRRGARLRAGGAEPELARAHLPRAPLHRRARRDHEPLARAGAGDASSSRASASRSSRAAPSRSATGSGRSCSASSSAACTGTGSSPAIRTRATSCCWPTGASRSWTSACSSACSASRSSSSWPASGPCRRATRQELHRLLARSGFLPEPERVDPEHLLAFIGDGDLVVHDRRRTGAADAGDRHAGDDRELRPALELLRARCATRTCAPSTCSAGAWSCSRSRSLSQLRARAQLAPDRARVDVRR